MSVATLLCDPQGMQVGRKRKDDEAAAPQGRGNASTPFNIRLPSALRDELSAVGENLGLDLASLIRTILREQLYIYVARAQQARDNLSQAKQRHKG